MKSLIITVTNIMAFDCNMTVDCNVDCAFVCSSSDLSEISIYRNLSVMTDACFSVILIIEISSEPVHVKVNVRCLP